jgi:hypothetical protein
MAACSNVGAENRVLTVGFACRGHYHCRERHGEIGLLRKK